jgi:hypothetical protein
LIRGLLSVNRIGAQIAASQTFGPFNDLVDAERNSRVLEQLPEDARQAISVITASELLHGVHRAAPIT